MLQDRGLPVEGELPPAAIPNSITSALDWE